MENQYKIDSNYFFKLHNDKRCVSSEDTNIRLRDRNDRLETLWDNKMSLGSVLQQLDVILDEPLK